MRLIINADDFGYSRGLNYGIVDAYQNGIVSSTTLLTTMPKTSEALELARANPGLGLGVHLTINLGKPFSDPTGIPSLIGDDGLFRKFSFEQISEVDVSEVEKEWTLQLKYIIDQRISPTHVDSHHHFHSHPKLLPIACKLASIYNLGIRALPPDYDYSQLSTADHENYKNIKKPDLTLIDFYGETVNENYFLNLFQLNPDLKSKTVELMCHPAYLDDIIYTQSSYNTKRVEELKTLKSKPVKDWIINQGIELITFNNL